MDFPVVTIKDMVRAQKMLLEHLGIRKVLAVVGGSMGGMQALQWMADYPERLRSAVLFATSAHMNAQALAFDAVGRHAIFQDPQKIDLHPHADFTDFVQKQGSAVGQFKPAFFGLFSIGEGALLMPE